MTVVVTATDSSGEANDNASVTITILVTDRDEQPVISEGGLIITGRSNIIYDEGDMATIAYTAVGPFASTTRWTLSGPDRGDFTISSSGVLAFRSSPDYEAEGDFDGDNVYEISVDGRDTTNTTASLNVRITVANIEEEGTVNLSSRIRRKRAPR